MAMRLFTKAEFEKHLVDQLSLEKTEIKTKTTQLWKTQNGKYITVPILVAKDGHPDYLLDDVYDQVARVESES